MRRSYPLLTFLQQTGERTMAETVLVTGSNSGFGRLIVETLARQGYTVVAGMRATSA